MTEPEHDSARGAADRRPILAVVFAAGVSSLTVQLALMREAMGAWAGNELVLGVVLGNWLLLMGLGAWLGRWKRWRGGSPRWLAGLLLLTAVVPPAQIAVLRGFRGWLGLEGFALSVGETVFGSFLLLLPYGLPAGCLLAVACTALAEPDPAQAAGSVYALDSVGSVVGGVLFSFVLVRWLDHLALLGVPALLNLLVAVWITLANRRPRGCGPESCPGRRPAPASAGVVLLLVLELSALAGLGWLWLADPDAATTAWQSPGQRLHYREHSPYGRLVVTEANGQTNVLENGVLLASIPNVEQAEETVHFAMAQRPSAARVLLIGGALSGAVTEALRHPAVEVHCVELDPLLLALGHKLSLVPSDISRLQTFAGDARQFVRRAEGPYDVVILALPDPSTVALNRLFTREFFGEVHRLLAPGGVVSFAVGRYENYASPELEQLLSCARRTAGAAFRNVLLMPGGRVRFLASDGPLTSDIAPALEDARLQLPWVNRHYLSATMTPDRLAGVERAAGAAAPVNRDLAPRLYYLHLRHWASQFEAGWDWLAGGLGLAVVVGLAGGRLRGAPAVVLASGFAAASLEVVLLLGLQILVGSLYQQVALVVTLFMAGLAVGAWAGMRWLTRRLAEPSGAGFQLASESAVTTLPLEPGSSPARRARRPQAALRLLVAILVGFALSLPLILAALGSPAGSRVGASTTEGMLGLLTFAFAVVVGAQFPLANRVEAGPGNPAGRLYTADFLGASLGALLTSTLLLPLFGVTGVCLGVAALNALAGWGLSRTATIS